MTRTSGPVLGGIVAIAFGVAAGARPGYRLDGPVTARGQRQGGEVGGRGKHLSDRVSLPVCKHALLIGGTRFIGRHTVTDLLAHGYEVALFNRGNNKNPFADHDDVAHVTGDRHDHGALRTARDEVDPDIVIDFVAMAPAHAETATGLSRWPASAPPAPAVVAHSACRPFGSGHRSVLPALRWSGPPRTVRTQLPRVTFLRV